MGNEFGWSREEVEKCQSTDFGSLGKVHIVSHWSYRRKYAVKVVTDKDVSLQLIKQVQRLKTFGNHPTLLHIFSVETSSDGSLLLWMDYCDLGDLQGYMDSNTLSTRNVISVMQQLCKAVTIIHSKGVVHGDIKPKSILLQNKLKVKLIFLSTSVQSFTAPEVLERNGYGHSADIYSMGVILHQMIEKCSYSFIEHMSNWFQGEQYSRKVQLRRLANEMTRYIPGERPNIEEVQRKLQNI